MNDEKGGVGEMREIEMRNAGRGCWRKLGELLGISGVGVFCPIEGWCGGFVQHGLEGWRGGKWLGGRGVGGLEWGFWHGDFGGSYVFRRELAVKWER